MENTMRFLINLIVVVALGISAAACVPAPANNFTYSYNGASEGYSFHSDPSAITRMNNGY